MTRVKLLDLHFGGNERAIGVYLTETRDGLALLDVGPTSTLPRLRDALAEQGTSLAEVRHLLLSHIHLDHAGAAGTIAREQPELTVWVSKVGAPHVVDPARLERSARRLYGDAFDPLWGELAPVPEANVRIADGDVVGWEAFPSPGHASHHVAYVRDGTLFAGDACGVRIQPAAYVLPVSPPPDADVEAWRTTIADLRRRRPERLALVHFGIEQDAADHLDRLEGELDRWAARVRGGMDADDFAEAARADAAADADLYDRVAPFRDSWLGLRRYWDTRER
jgi:glyoxylase-like metal-dependent hydrolase (beta-lactamase superfamily II)